MLALARNSIFRLPVLVIMLAAYLAAPGLGVASGLAQADPAAPPEIGAKAAIVVEYPSGHILYSKSMHDQLAPASTTKILTAILALEHGNLEQSITIAPEDMVGESTMGLQAGETPTLHNLLYGMLLPSGNDAAMAIARTLGSEGAAPGATPAQAVSHFAELMNTRVTQLGLADSHFINPHGLDAEGHHSSAYDLASLTWYALHFPVFNEVVKQKFYQAPDHPLRNTNEMLSRYEGADGVKTGWTDAGGLCLVTAATRDGHRLISVVLNAPHWYTDSTAILDYGFAKLAASPSADAEVLTVVGRGSASWLLASATSTPPLPPVTGMKQGGGTGAPAVPMAPSGGGSQVGAPGAQSSTEGRSAGVEGPVARTGGTLLNGTVVMSGSSSRSTNGALALVLLLAAGLAGGLWFVAGKPGPPGRGTAIVSTSYPLEHLSSAPRRYDRTAPTASPARTLGAAPRREPNLMLTPEEAGTAHLRRAVALQAEGLQGSAMSEFVLALKAGCEIDAVQLGREQPLTAGGFLALARAKSSVGLRPQAVATLEQARAAFPHDRLIGLTWRQMRGE